MTIRNLLSEGRQNARTGKQLADDIGCNMRELTLQIEKERRLGVPICASTGDNPGYFLPADDEELETYCASLDRRERELRKTKRAMLKMLDERQQAKGSRQ